MLDHLDVGPGTVEEHHGPHARAGVGEDLGVEAVGRPAVADRPVGANVEAVRVRDPVGLLRRRGREQVPALRRQDAPSAVEQHADVGGHVGRGRRNAAVPGRGLDPGRRDQRPARHVRPVVSQGRVADRLARARLVRGDRIGRPHPERLEDALGNDLRVAATGHRLEDEPERLVAEVRVVEARARGPCRIGLAQPPHLAHALAGEVPAVDDAGGVVEEVVRRNRFEARSDFEPGQVARHRRVQVEASALDLAQQGDGRERLPDRPDLEQRVGGDRAITDEIGNAERRAVQRLVAIGERHCRARSPRRGEKAPDLLVEHSERPLAHRSSISHTLDDEHRAYARC